MLPSQRALTGCKGLSGSSGSSEVCALALDLSEVLFVPEVCALAIGAPFFGKGMRP